MGFRWIGFGMNSVCASLLCVGLGSLLPVSVAMGAEAPDPAESSGGDPADPLVGAYYYPWYRPASSPGRDQWLNVMRTRLDPPQDPEAGRYDSSDPELVAEHIRQSVRAGLDFWAVSWWGPGERSQSDRNLKEVILPHPEAHRLRYAILYESTGRLGSFDQPDYDAWLPDLAYLRETYFEHPLYLRVDGRPVLFVYLTRVYFRDRGHDALQAMREQFPEIYLIGDDVFSPPPHPTAYRDAWARPFDAVTAYDVYGQSIGPLGGTRRAVEHLAAGYVHAKAEANRTATAFVPAVAPGYNDTAVREGHPGRGRSFSDIEGSKEGDVFRAMIREVAIPTLDPLADRMMMVTSFNEWFEDTQIEATTGTAPPTSRDQSPSGTAFTGGDRYEDYGPLYLDILRTETRGGEGRQ